MEGSSNLPCAALFLSQQKFRLFYQGRRSLVQNPTCRLRRKLRPFFVEYELVHLLTLLLFGELATVS